MKKQILIFSVLLVITISLLSGCVSDESKFEGTWRTKPIAGISIGFTFNSDGTLTIEGGQTSLGNWMIKDGKLILSSDVVDPIELSGSFSYKFSDDNQQVTLTNNTTTITLLKD
jgi:hypothetical protein